MSSTPVPRVSIGFPVYNGEGRLDKALRSLRAQDFTDFELILCDNGSTDRTEQICRDHMAQDPRLRYHRNETNLGAALNFKRAFDLSRGPYFMWAAHDDLWEPAFVSRCVAGLDAHPGAVLCTSRVRFVDATGRPVTGVDENELHTLGLPQRERVRALVRAFGWYAIYGLMRREAVANIRLGLTIYGLDVVQLMELSLQGSFIQIPEFLFHYTVKNKSIADDMRVIDPSRTGRRRDGPHTGLARDLVESIGRWPLDPAQKALLQTDLVRTLCFENRRWHDLLLTENPSLQNILLDKDTVPSGQSEAFTLGVVGAFLGVGNASREPVTAESPVPTRIPVCPLKVLFVNRPNVFTQPGGDTIVMKRYRHHLAERGIQVGFALHPGTDLRGYDMVHAFNLTTPSITEPFAESAAAARLPFLVTALQEDHARFHAKANATVSFFKHYIEQGQPVSMLGELKPYLDGQTARPTATAPYAAAVSDRLLACGAFEADVIRRLHPSARVSVAMFGSSVRECDAGPGLFAAAFGVSDYILCTGRLETRKNQLMLLCALQDHDIPVVFVDGGFTYQDVYKDLCTRFKRRGPTLFTGRLSDEMLVSAYRGARAHVLPSWYELPGLVTLEAALYGCPVVASTWGGIADYLGDACDTCEPDDPAGIRRAIQASLNRPRSDAARVMASEHTWEGATNTLMAAYLDVLEARSQGRQPDVSSIPPPDAASYDVHVFVDKVTRHVEQGDHVSAVRLYQQYRGAFPPLEQLARFDDLMRNLAAKTGPAS